MISRRTDFNIRKSFKGQKNNNEKQISIITQDNIVKVPISQIEIIEQEGRRLQIVTSFGTFECYDNINHVEPFVEGSNFYRAMKSMLINMDRVVKIGSGEITMSSGLVLSMGKNNYGNFRQAFKKYLCNYPPFGNAGAGSKLSEDGKVRGKISCGVHMVERNAGNKSEDEE